MRAGLRPKQAVLLPKSLGFGGFGFWGFFLLFGLLQGFPCFPLDLGAQPLAQGAPPGKGDFFFFPRFWEWMRGQSSKRLLRQKRMRGHHLAPPCLFLGGTSRAWQHQSSPGRRSRGHWHRFWPEKDGGAAAAWSSTHGERASPHSAARLSLGMAHRGFCRAAHPRGLQHFQPQSWTRCCGMTPRPLAAL